MSGHGAIGSARPRSRRQKGALLLVGLAAGLAVMALFEGSGDALAEAEADAPVIELRQPEVVLIGGDTLPGETANLAPGRVLSQEYELRNTGDVPVRYSLAFATREAEAADLATAADLAPALFVEMRLAHPRDGCASFAGELLSADSLAAFSVGGSTSGGQPRQRTLRPGGVEVLCSRMLFVPSADDRYQASRVAVRLVVVAEAIDDLQPVVTPQSRLRLPIRRKDLHPDEAVIAGARRGDRHGRGPNLTPAAALDERRTMALSAAR
jgi:hypothetical protein